MNKTGLGEEELVTLEAHLYSFILPLWTTGKVLNKIAEKGIQEELLLLLGEARRVRLFQISDIGTAEAAVKNQSS